jgi:hypothetical protein
MSDSLNCAACKARGDAMCVCPVLIRRTDTPEAAEFWRRAERDEARNEVTVTISDSDRDVLRSLLNCARWHSCQVDECDAACDERVALLDRLIGGRDG